MRRDGRPLCGVQATLSHGSSRGVKGGRVRFYVDECVRERVCSAAALHH